MRSINDLERFIQSGASISQIQEYLTTWKAELINEIENLQKFLSDETPNTDIIIRCQYDLVRAYIKWCKGDKVFLGLMQKFIGAT